MSTATLRAYVYPALVFHIVSCVEQPWNSEVNIIRVQNNGSEIRTIFLPKPSSAVISDTTSLRNREKNTTLNSSNLVLIGQSVHHDDLYVDHDNGNFTTYKQKIFNKNAMSAITNKKHHKIVRVNSSEPYQRQNFINKKKKDPSTNRTLISGNVPEVEFKVSAEKIAKILNLFTIVNFTNEHCYTNEGLIGVCYHAIECKSIAGEARGLCAEGFGVCCYVERSCGERSAANNTYVTSADIDLDSQTDVYICTVVIDKITPDVRQLQLTFDNFELAGPVNGNCAVDRFVVTVENRNDIIPPLCGLNTGKHVYVDVDGKIGPVSLTLLSSGAHGVPKNFKVRVTQLRNGDPLLAPKHCLQYYTDLRGSVESFNYIPLNSTVSGVITGYFNNLNYAVCFKKEPGYCGIVYTNMATSGLEYVFELVNAEDDGAETVPIGQAGAEGFDCPDDYITLSGVRLCGYKLNDGSSQVDYSTNYPVTDNTNGPLILEFRTNKNMTGRGFHLDYSLSLCSAVTTPTPKPSPPQTFTLPPPAATRISVVTSIHPTNEKIHKSHIRVFL